MHSMMSLGLVKVAKDVLLDFFEAAQAGADWDHAATQRSARWDASAGPAGWSAASVDHPVERARNNVRHALGKVRAALRKGGREEKGFAAHLQSRLEHGYDCMYSQAEGRIWG